MIAWLIAGGVALAAPASWQAEAPLAVVSAGTVTLEVPPALHRESAAGLDLDLLGPEGESRPFELYLREDRGAVSVVLRPGSVRLLGTGFRWEAGVPADDRIRATGLEIAVAAGDYAGRVRIDGRLNGAWTALARDAAIYAARGTERTRVELAPGAYDAFRLTFTAWGKRPVPVDRVTVVGTRIGEAAVMRPLSLAATLTRTTDGAWFDVALPGSGLDVTSVEITPAARFAGGWSVERATVRAGRREYVAVASGTEAAVGRDRTVRMPVASRWPGRAMRIRLTAGDRHVGAVSRVTVRVRLPRLAFVAEGPGAYRIVAGGGRNVAVQDVRGAAPDSAPRTGATLGDVSRNAVWKPVDLVAQYGLMGARFAPSGYRWTAAVRIDGPGYWRLALPERASLEADPAGLRLVRDGLQVPFLLDDGEIRTVAVPVTESLDAAANTTTWRITLPRPSSRWLGLRLRAAGIFSRTVEIAPDTPVPVGAPVLGRLTWTHAEAGPAWFDLPLDGLPPGVTTLRIVIAHGQNRPIKLDAAEAFYRVPGLSFLADAPEGYVLWGGHASAGGVRYDLDLVADRLADELPGRAESADIVEASPAGAWAAIVRPFGEARWGLYAVLAILTASLVAIIVRLFPASPTRLRRR